MVEGAAVVGTGLGTVVAGTVVAGTVVGTGLGTVVAGTVVTGTVVVEAGTVVELGEVTVAGEVTVVGEATVLGVATVVEVVDAVGSAVVEVVDADGARVVDVVEVGSTVVEVGEAPTGWVVLVVIGAAKAGTTPKMAGAARMAATGTSRIPGLAALELRRRPLGFELFDMS